MSPDVSVVVCAYTERRWDDIVAALQALRTQTRAPDDVVLVIDHNPGLLDRARARFGSEPGVRVMASDRENGLSGARNTGIAAATGDLVAFLDDDATPDSRWLETLVEPFADPAVVATGGRAEPRWPGAAPRWFPAEFAWVVGCSYTGLPTATGEVRNVIGCSMAFRAAALSRVGGFVEGVGRVGTVPRGAEETELCIRLRQRIEGARILHVHDSLVSHRVGPERVSARYFLSRCRAEGLSKAQIGRLIGHADGTATERAYVRRVLPAGVAANLRQAARGDRFGLVRALLIVAGLATTAFGYGVGLTVERFRSG